MQHKTCNTYTVVVSNISIYHLYVFLNYPKTPKSEILKVSEKYLKSGKLKKKTTFTLTTLKVVRVKVVLFFRISHV